MTDPRHFDTARRALDYGMGMGVGIVHARIREDATAKAIYDAAVATIARILEVQAGRKADCHGLGHTGCGECERCRP